MDGQLGWFPLNGITIWRNFVLQCNGASKKYKSANAFFHLKQVAKTFNLDIMLDLYGSGNRKGLIDGVDVGFLQRISF